MKNIDKLNPKVVAMTLAITSGIIYIICAVLFIVSPVGALNLFKDMFHGIDITQIGKTNITFGSAVAGFVETIILALIVGWLFAVIYNKMLKKGK